MIEADVETAFGNGDSGVSAGQKKRPLKIRQIKMCINQMEEKLQALPLLKQSQQLNPQLLLNLPLMHKAKHLLNNHQLLQSQ